MNIVRAYKSEKFTDRNTGRHGHGGKLFRRHKVQFTAGPEITVITGPDDELVCQDGLSDKGFRFCADAVSKNIGYNVYMGRENDGLLEIVRLLLGEISRSKKTDTNIWFDDLNFCQGLARQTLTKIKI